MNDRGCPYEDSVIQAMRSGQWSEELRSHSSRCRQCAEAEQVFRWMGRVAEACRSAEAVPDPSLLWLKAQWNEQQTVEKRALRPVIFAQAAAQFGLLAALLFLSFWKWPAVNRLIGRSLLALPAALLHPSLPSIEGPWAYLTSPALILPCLALGYYFLQSRLRRAFEM